MNRCAVVLGAAFVAAGLAYACSAGDGGGTTSTPVEAGASARVDSGTPGRPDGGGVREPPIPEGVPQGWVRDQTYDPSCLFYVPTNGAQLPPPPTWEACPSHALPTGTDCRLMAVDWTPVSQTDGGAAETGWYRADGSLVLAIRRAVNTPPNSMYELFTSPDGPVYSALLITSHPTCSAAFARGYDDRFVLGVYERGESRGGLFGRLDAVAPTVGVHLPKQEISYAFYASAFGPIVGTISSNHFYSWEGSDLGAFWSRAQDDGLALGDVQATATALFWPASDQYRHKVNVYTPGGGVRSFLSKDFELDRGYTSLGTDGHDLVWLEGMGRPKGAALFDSLRIMTAPYTTDPAAVTPRRLRSEVGGVLSSADAFVVGCGHAAISTSEHIRVVRLSDGQSWILPKPESGPWSWRRPIAVTCDEIFAMATSAGASRLARIRIDSLGPGIAAD